MTQLKIKEHVVIVGGSSGIGRALALHLAESCHVAVLARRTGVLKELESVSKIFSVKADVSSFDDMSYGLEECVKRFGKIDKLIYCAGIQIVKPHRMMGHIDFDSLYEVNLRGALYASKLFCSSKISEKNGVFCAISSIAAVKPEPGIIGYSVMKAALDNMIRGLAKESAPRRFVGVSPGWLDTEMTQNQFVYGGAFKEALEKKSPLGLTNVEDVVNAVEFLISNKSASITGQVLCVDSGSSL